MKKLLVYILPAVLLFCALCTISCDDDDQQVPRLFRPSFIESMCVADSDTITLCWRTTAEATTYTVEISTDSLFAESATLSQTVASWTCRFMGLPFKTAYYVRAKANNEDRKLYSNWTVLKEPIVTDSLVTTTPAKRNVLFERK